jgi:nitroreductase
MDVLEAIQQRRSTRAFLEKPVPRETIEKLLSLATQAPSAINLQPWEISVVSGEEKSRLSRILVKRMKERNISEGSCNFYGAPTALILSIDEVFSHARWTDMGIVAGYIVLAAHAMGLGTCPIGLITAFEEEIREELNLPEEKQVIVGIALGYPDPKSPINRGRSERAPLGEVVRWRE